MIPLPRLPQRLRRPIPEPVARALVARGLTPDVVSIAGLFGNVGAAALVASGDLAAGGAVMLAASALDMLDGALARASGTATPFGAVLDATLDRLSEAAVLFGVAVYATATDRREEALLAFVAVAGSMLVSYVRARAEVHGALLTEGLATRPQRVILLGAGLITGWLRPALWALAALSLLTAMHRLILARRALRP